MEPQTPDGHTPLPDAHAALRESEERLRVTLENAVDYAILNTNPEGLIEGWSRGAEKIFGWTEAEVLGQSADLIFTPEDRVAGAPQWERETALREGFSPDERYHIRKDGSRFYMSGTMRPIYDGGVLRGFVKVARDLTAQQQTQEALRVTEERYRVALQSAHMAAWDWNIVEDKVEWNDQHFLILGLPPEDRTVTAEFFMQFVHPVDLPAVSKALEKAVVEKSIYHMEAFRIIRADNQEVRWMTGYGRVVEAQDGKATRMVGVMYEVTARVKDTKALYEKQLKLEIAQRAARIGIWGYDLVKEQGIATPEWNELTGYPDPKESFEMETFLNLVHPDDRPQLIAAHNKAVEERDGVEVEFRLHHPEKGWLWMLKRGHYIPPYDDVNATLMGSLIDITERKLFEQQKDDFISVASHELRTPVTSIKAYAEILAEKFAKSGDLQSSALMEKLDAQIDRLTALIYSLLDTTRIAEGKMQLEKTVFAIDDLLLEAADMMGPIAGQQPINLSLKAAAWVEADRERIHQVLINLLSNAIKYSSGAEAIQLSSSVEEDGLRVCVQDAGIGISTQGQQRVFDRFFRETEAAQFPGLGLGLFISANIIREHGGEIWVKSSPGQGALFCFTLPLAASR